MPVGKNAVYLRLGILAALLALFGAIVTDHFPSEWLSAVRSHLPGSNEAGLRAAALENAAPDPKMQAHAQAPVGPSAWIEADRKRHLAAITEARPDIVVVPYQILRGENRFGIDLHARMVMTHMTSERIAISKRLKVADVEMTARALGEPRYLSRDEAVAFGRVVGAGTVVYGLTHHDGRGNLSVSLESISTAGGAAGNPATIDAIPISDVSTPELAFRAVADGLVRRIGAGVDRAPKPYSLRDNYFPDSPVVAISTEPANPVEGIWLQQFLAMLHSPHGFQERSRILERTLAGLDAVSPEAPDYRLLAARAVSQMQRRPAALEIIGKPRTPEELALVEYLNGNVPELTAAIEKIGRPLPRLIAQFDLLSLRGAYNLDSGETQRLAEEYAKGVPEAWRPAVLWHVAMQSAWLTRSTMEMKLVMDAHFPIKGYSADDLLRGKAVAGSPYEPRVAVEVEGFAIQHAHRIIEQNGKDWCCSTEAWKPRPAQYLHLLDAFAKGMLLHTVGRTHGIHGNSERALQMVDLLNQVIFQDGYAPLQYQAMFILSALVDQERSPERKAALANRLYQTAKQVRQWEVADSGVVIDAVIYERKGAQIRFSVNQETYPDLNEMKLDFPPTYNVLRNSDKYKSALQRIDDMAILQRTCSHAYVQMRACFAWRSGLEATGRIDDAKKVEQEQLIARFRGNPYLMNRLSELMSRRGDLEAARAYAQQSIAAAPNEFKGYQDLAYLDLQAGNYQAAEKSFMGYPLFTKPGDANTVIISNNAHSAGTRLARRGAVKEAKRFYEIAAQFRNGSSASYDAAIRLAYMERRFGDAEKTALQGAQHYRGSAHTKDYIALLFVLGDSNAAWAASREAIARYASIDSWYAVPVGFRVDGATADTVHNWAREISRLPPGRAGDGSTNGLYALTIAIQTLAMDRNGDALKSIPRLRTEIFGKANDLTIPDTTGRTRGPADHLSALDRFIAGYLAHQSGEFETAWNVFQNWSHGGQNDNANDVLANTLPYHAHAAVKTGRAAAFGAYLEMYAKTAVYAPLDELPKQFPRFDIYLARAILAAAAGNHAEAGKQLLLAKSIGQVPASRAFPPDYVFAEICELLSTETGRREYVDVGVSWSKAYQVNEPWAAWAYAFEAKHGKVDADRAKAYAIARYLDAKSTRLAGVEPHIVKQADQWLARNKPFPREQSSAQARTL